MGTGRRANFTRHRRYIQSQTNLEAQGQRLSNNNPNDDDDDQSLLILFSAQRHAQPLQTKLSEMNAKCSCSKMAATELEKCLTTLERKQQTLIDDRKCKVVRTRKEKRDAATSPQLPCKDNIDNSKSKDVNLKICNSPARSGTVRLSPRRDIPTRNAATSPQVDARRQAQAAAANCATAETETKANEATSSVTAPKMSLEKSKSLSESRPQRQLRTTRSLSPRPPIRHQQAIIISCQDEHDVVLKVTPSDDVRYDHSVKPRKSKAKSQSEQTSPNLSDCGTFFPDDRYANNRSTGCLVYVPSDPWMKMDSNDSKSERSATVRNKTADNDNDPWIHRNSENQNSKSPKISRQSQRSGSSKTDIRPAQPRSKSPAINDELAKEPKHKGSLIDSSTENLILSPTKKPHTSPTASLSPLDNGKRAKNSHLSVNNSNLLQPRHSFSSPSQKEDELQLNIRRLSEQIKGGGYSTTSSTCVAPSTDFTSYLNQIKKEKTLTKGIRNSGNAVDADVVLETTC